MQNQEKNFEVKVASYYDLANEGISVFNPVEDYTKFIRITHKGECIAVHSDDMEPEDATFSRDLSWISEEIKKAYDLGFNDGKESV